MAMASLPVWYFTSDPLWAVVLLTSVDVMGFGPTFRKAYVRPFEEKLTLFAIMTVRDMIVILALEHYSVTTVLFPATIASVCLIFVIMVLLRRRAEQ
jgi:membrane glycosyltransferase